MICGGNKYCIQRSNVVVHPTIVFGNANKLQISLSFHLRAEHPFYLVYMSRDIKYIIREKHGYHAMGKLLH